MYFVTCKCNNIALAGVREILQLKTRMEYTHGIMWHCYSAHTMKNYELVMHLPFGRSCHVLSENRVPSSFQHHFWGKYPHLNVQGWFFGRLLLWWPGPYTHLTAAVDAWSNTAVVEGCKSFSAALWVICWVPGEGKTILSSHRQKKMRAKVEYVVVKLFKSLMAFVMLLAFSHIMCIYSQRLDIFLAHVPFLALTSPLADASWIAQVWIFMEWLHVPDHVKLPVLLETH